MTNKSQLNQYYEKGYVVIEDAISQGELNTVRDQIEQWVHDSRFHKSSYGKLIDGQPRFDLEPGHKSIKPKLRRITNPIEISKEIRELVFKRSMTELLVPILGEDIKFDHCKINTKYPGMHADVKYHQDHIFEPQTNDSVVVALLMLDDTTVENGCLKIVPRSHKTRYPHAINGAFTGRVGDEFLTELDSKAEMIEAKAGSICLMDTWAVHGSAINGSLNPRRLMITEYKSADAFPMTEHKIPSRYMDAVIRGTDAISPRYRETLDFEIHHHYEGDSLFDLQDIVENEKKTRFWLSKA